MATNRARERGLINHWSPVPWPCQITGWDVAQRGRFESAQAVISLPGYSLTVSLLKRSPPRARPRRSKTFRGSKTCSWRGLSPPLGAGGAPREMVGYIGS